MSSDMLAVSTAETAPAGAANAARGDEMAGFLSTRFGEVRFNPQQQIRFRGGLPGFPDLEIYQLDRPAGIDGDLLLLQSIDTPDIAFFVLPLGDDADPIAPADLDEACQRLEIPRADLLVLLVVNLSRERDGLRKFVNLRAPILIDVAKRRGAQLVLPNADYPMRFALDH